MSSMAAHRIVMFGWAQSAHVQRWVAGLHRRGFEIKLISLGGAAIEGAQCRTFPYGGKWRYPVYALSAGREARAFAPDLVHVHYAGGFGLWGLASRRHPLLVSVWGADIMESARHPLMRAIVRHLLRRADALSATSRFLADVAVALEPSAQAKLTLIPFGVTIPTACWPQPGGPPIRILFLKAHRAKYGPELAIRALALATPTHPNLTLTLAGQGELTQNLRSLAAACGVADRVSFPGFIPQTEVYECIREHHLMVMPSISASESFGVAALEAAACGRAVVASRIGGIPEVVQDDRTGLLVTPGSVEELAQALTRLADDASLRERLGAGGYAFAREQYDWERCLDRMAELYDRLIYEAKQHPAL